VSVFLEVRDPRALEQLVHAGVAEHTTEAAESFNRLAVESGNRLSVVS